MTGKTDDKYGVLLSEDGWRELGETLAPYQQEGAIGKYLYCKELCFDGPFVKMTVTPEQTGGRIDCVMQIYIPDNFVTFIAQTPDRDRAPAGFR